MTQSVARELPEGLKAYRRTPDFTEADVPSALLNEHSTKEGTWGHIIVKSGQLRYLVTDPRRQPFERVLTAGSSPGVVEPTVLHRVEPIGAVQFYVQFLRAEPA